MNNEPSENNLSKTFTKLLKEYIEEPYRMCSSMPKDEWGNIPQAQKYLEKYWLNDSEYESHWKSIQDSIFINQQMDVPDLGFRDGFKLYPLRGGELFVRDYFEKLRSCIQKTGDKNFVLVQNTQGKKLARDLVPFKMKYPITISWQELNSGNFISSFLFEFPMYEYFVFGDTAKWAWYAASDYRHPLNLVIFQHEYGSLFRETFKVNQSEWTEIFGKWLPKEYQQYL